MVANIVDQEDRQLWMPGSCMRLWRYLVAQKQLLLFAAALFHSDSWALLVLMSYTVILGTIPNEHSFAAQLEAIYKYGTTPSVISLLFPRNLKPT